MPELNTWLKLAPAFRREMDCADAQAAIAAVRALGRERVVTFVGFSALGYEDETAVRDIIVRDLANFDPDDTLVCAGATSEGIGMVYAVAVQRGFRTAGIVSALARAEGVPLSAECEAVCFVDDTTWGGTQPSGRLSATSQATVDACSVMIGIGGGAIARDELQHARSKGKTVRFHNADMNHALAAQKAAKSGKPAPQDFAGEAQSLFANV